MLASRQGRFSCGIDSTVMVEVAVRHLHFLTDTEIADVINPDHVGSCGYGTDRLEL